VEKRIEIADRVQFNTVGKYCPFQRKSLSFFAFQLSSGSA
jgi:hypothetical protein